MLCILFVDNTLRPKRSTVAPILAVLTAGQLIRYLLKSAGCRMALD